MKTQNRVSQLTLELYHRGLATRKERKEVEKALLADFSVQERYEALKEAEREINQFVTEEMRLLNIPEAPITPAVHSVNIVWGIIAAAAVLICALVPVFLHLRSSSQNKNNAVAENPVESPAKEPSHEPDIIIEEIKIAEDTPVEDKTSAPEQPARRERGSSNERPKIAVTPSTEIFPASPEVFPASPEVFPMSPDIFPMSNDFEPEADKTEIAAISEMETVIRFRGQSDDANPPEEDADIAIPPGITFIFENMFANKLLVWIEIPDRIRSIAKNAYAGNPLLYVTIGADVDVHDEAIPGNFAKAYNSYGRQAGFYTRPDSESEEWKKE
jgi:hypothetical protein